MKKFTNFLNESSLSRVYTQYKLHDTGTISAFRDARDCGDGEPYSKEENKKRSTELKAKLLKFGYGVTKIKGTYIERYNTPTAKEVKEDSYIVVDLKDTGKLKKDLIKLGVEYDQDSITYSEKDGTYFLISSNKCKNGYPGNGVIGKEVRLGKPMFGKSGEFHSKISNRPFVFESSVYDKIQTLECLSISEIRSVNEFAKSTTK